MARSFNELLAKMSPERRKRIDDGAKAMMAEMVLSELRRMSGKTQVQLAKELGISQPSLSQLESQDDIQISTLSRFIKALGGELEIVARMPQGRVAIRQFEDAAV